MGLIRLGAEDLVWEEHGVGSQLEMVYVRGGVVIVKDVVLVNLKQFYYSFLQSP